MNSSAMASLGTAIATSDFDHELMGSADMRSKKLSPKSRAVLKALAKVRSYDQVMTGKRGLTSHDVFRALSESPTSFWKRKPGGAHERGSAR